MGSTSGHLWARSSCLDRDTRNTGHELLRARSIHPDKTQSEQWSFENKNYSMKDKQQKGAKKGTRMLPTRLETKDQTTDAALSLADGLLCRSFDDIGNWTALEKTIMDEGIKQRRALRPSPQRHIKIQPSSPKHRQLQSPVHYSFNSGAKTHWCMLITIPFTQEWCELPNKPLAFLKPYQVFWATRALNGFYFSHKLKRGHLKVVTWSQFHKRDVTRELGIITRRFIAWKQKPLWSKSIKEIPDGPKMREASLPSTFFGVSLLCASPRMSAQANFHLLWVAVTTSCASGHWMNVDVWKLPNATKFQPVSVHAPLTSRGRHKYKNKLWPHHEAVTSPASLPPLSTHRNEMIAQISCNFLPKRDSPPKITHWANSG